MQNLQKGSIALLHNQKAVLQYQVREEGEIYEG
jgi:hypothetical protein